MTLLLNIIKVHIFNILQKFFLTYCQTVTEPKFANIFFSHKWILQLNFKNANKQEDISKCIFYSP